jgi:peptidoglycan/LPS O-acetylase OafA/YrhL
MNGRPRRVFETLDGLRAVGAQLVVMRHVPEFFGGVPVPESFLAVDLFFLISGIVVSHAYGERVRAGGFFKRFTITRLIRLYPLYALGLVLGLIPATISLATDPNSWWTPLKLVEAVLAGALMFPLVPFLGANGSSLDGPTWTLLPEIAANLVWAQTLKRLGPFLLAAVLIVCGAGVIFASQIWGQLDVGYGPTQTWAAFARSGYSFFAGVLVFQLFGVRKTVSPLVSWLCLAILALVLAWRPGESATQIYEVVAVLAGFPALVVVAAHFEPGPRVGKLFALLGRASWGVYIFHQPIGRILEATVLHGWTPPKGAMAVLVGVVFTVGLTGFTLLVDRVFDLPIRRALTRRLLPPPVEAAPKAPAHAG